MYRYQKFRAKRYLSYHLFQHQFYSLETFRKIDFFKISETNDKGGTRIAVCQSNIYFFKSDL